MFATFLFPLVTLSDLSTLYSPFWISLLSLISTVSVLASLAVTVFTIFLASYLSRRLIIWTLANCLSIKVARDDTTYPFSSTCSVSTSTLKALSCTKILDIKPSSLVKTSLLILTSSSFLFEAFPKSKKTC